AFHPGPLFLLTASLPLQCDLSGAWRSSMGCRIVVSELSEAGEFSGLYHPVPMASKADTPPLLLRGIQHTTQEQPTFGFTVKWHFSGSVSVFVGQCFMDDQGEETLQTTWLLRKEVRSLSADWEAFRWVTGHRRPRKHPQLGWVIQSFVQSFSL
uniref:Avidin n=1 Tax=Chelydra serpentina TaxID=8475 RepID=A0A8C3T0P2_CHESE